MSRFLEALMSQNAEDERVRKAKEVGKPEIAQEQIETGKLQENKVVADSEIVEKFDNLRMHLNYLGFSNAEVDRELGEGKNN